MKKTYIEPNMEVVTVMVNKMLMVSGVETNGETQEVETVGFGGVFSGTSDGDYD